MRPTILTLLSGLALISVSACANLPDGTGASNQTSLSAACSWLESYPGCQPPHGEQPGTSLASASQAAGS